MATTINIVYCNNCLRARLMRYSHNPVIAECQEKPQPGNERFPFEREVANAPRRCSMWKQDPNPKEVEQRISGAA